MFYNINDVKLGSLPISSGRHHPIDSIALESIDSMLCPWLPLS